MNIFLHFLRIAFIFSAVAFVVSMFSFNNWAGELFVSFSMLHFLSTIVFVVLYSIFKKRQWMFLALGLMVLQGIFVYQSLHSGAKAQEPAEQASLGVFQYNVYYRNAHCSDIAAWLISHHQDHDILLLQEIQPYMMSDFKKLKAFYPYMVLVNGKNDFGQLFFSKKVIKHHTIHSVRNSGAKFMKAVVETDGGQEMTVFAIHTTAPTSSVAFHRRNQELRTLQAQLKDTAGTKIVIGDLNVTPFSDHFKNCIKEANLNFAVIEHGKNTWASFLPAWVRTTIDHCLVSADIQVVDRQIGPNLGSDHLPVMTRIAFKR
jgi:endonuclease/exonuclease/phosphatase (EEP) superfamily protein YafD